MSSKKWIGLAAFVGASISAVLLHASTATIMGIGNLSYSQAVNGPADVTFRQFTSMPGEMGSWHFHPGAVHNIVTAGAITIEDGCGGEQTYSTGQGWEQLNGRVHRWKNLGTAAEAEFNTFIVPEGSPTTNTLPTQRCGPPAVVNECQNDGWRSYDFPRAFGDQKDCVNFVRKRL